MFSLMINDKQYQTRQRIFFSTGYWLLSTVYFF
jgi:hypothetical protein